MLPLILAQFFVIEDKLNKGKFVSTSNSIKIKFVLSNHVHSLVKID